MRAIGYIRCSTAEQERSGLGLSAQKQAIANECERRGWELSDMAADTLSANAKHRPGYERALERLDAGELEALVVSRLDRVARSALGFAELLARADKQGWVVVVMDPAVDMSTPYGRALAGVAAVFAELESALIAQRTKEGIAAKVAAGGRHGGERVVPDSTVEIIRGYRRRKTPKSYREIARLLDAEGIPTAKGGPWHHGFVRHLATTR